MYYGLNSDFQKRDVAIYARVSTEHEAQLSALGNQLDWYKPILAARPDWTLTAQYIDEGITGTSAEKRPQFMKMIEDCRSGLIDCIWTKSVSRFGRNTVDTLVYTRELRNLGSGRLKICASQVRSLESPPHTGECLSLVNRSGP